MIRASSPCARIHEALDRAVLAAYPRLPGIGAPDALGWSDIAVPPYCISSPEDAARLAAFEDEVIDRLFVLNEQRAHEEAILGRAGKPTKTSKAGAAASKRAARAVGPAGSNASKKKGSKKGSPNGQGSLGIKWRR